jgi:hypothetical protein
MRGVKRSLSKQNSNDVGGRRGVKCSRESPNASCFASLFPLFFAFACLHHHHPLLVVSPSAWITWPGILCYNLAVTREICFCNRDHHRLYFCTWVSKLSVISWCQHSIPLLMQSSFTLWETSSSSVVSSYSLSKASESSHRTFCAILFSLF